MILSVRSFYGVYGSKTHKLVLQSLLLQRSNLYATPSNNLIKHLHSGSGDNPILLNHRDWLSPAEAVKIFQNLKDPIFALPLFDQISSRKDYKPNEALYSTVINKLAAVKQFDEIENLMERIKLERNCRLSDEFFRQVIKIYGHSAGRINRAIETLFAMPEYKCWPSVKTFNFVLNLLVSTKQFDVVHEVYMGASKLGIEVDACCLNIIIKGLCEFGDVEAAFNVLDEFPKQKCRTNVRTFSTIMHGLCERGCIDDAFKLLERMEMEGVEPDAIVFNILISGLRKRGECEEGIKMFDGMMNKGCDPNPGTYQEVLYCLLDAKKFMEAKEFMRKMAQKGVNPSFESYKLVINGFCKQKLVADVDWALRQMARHGFIPRMGMWKQVLHCLFIDGSCTSNFCFLFEEIMEVQRTRTSRSLKLVRQ